MAATIALELYTLRDFITDRASLATNLARIREIGYRAVEFSGVEDGEGESLNTTARENRRILDDSGIECVALHRPWRALREDTEAEIEFAQTIGSPFVAVPIIMDEYDRYAYDKEKRGALEKWARKLRRIIGAPAGGKVVAITR